MTAAAPGFSPLLGGTLDYFLGWRWEFLFVGIYIVCAGSAFVALVGETNYSGRRSIGPGAIARSYLTLLRDARFYTPAITSSMVMAGLFAILSATVACGHSPTTPTPVAQAVATPQPPTTLPFPTVNSSCADDAVCEVAASVGARGCS